MEGIGYIMLIVIVVILAIVVGVAVSVTSKKRLDDAQKSLGLIQGKRYEIITNDGSKRCDLIFSHIHYGNRSQNGNINLYFIKPTKYRGTVTNKTVMIKYNNVWKITALGVIPQVAPKNDL